MTYVWCAHICICLYNEQKTLRKTHSDIISKRSEIIHSIQIDGKDKYLKLRIYFVIFTMRIVRKKVIFIPTEHQLLYIEMLFKSSCEYVSRSVAITI